MFPACRRSIPRPANSSPLPIERQTELVLEQLKLCLEAAGASLRNVMKCNVFCTSAKHFAAVNAIYARYFPEDPPARIFVCIPEWTGPFDIEIDCIAVVLAAYGGHRRVSDVPTVCPQQSLEWWARYA